MVRSYRDLRVWQKAMILVMRVYADTRRLPKHETYGLASQLQRAVVSVAANIAEGNGRIHRAEYLHHISIAFGSLMEVETLITIAKELEYLPPAEEDRLLGMSAEVSRMLLALRRRLAETKA